MQPIDRILVATDFSKCSEPAMDYACSLAVSLDAELHLLHVVPDPAVFALDPTALPAAAFYEAVAEQDAAAVEALAKLPPNRWDIAKPILRATRQGSARDQIVQYAFEHDIGLIVVGTHGRSGFSRLMLGSIAEGVLRLAECPVLTVRSPE